MFKRIYIDNYRNLVNFSLHLEELTLLVGPNGVGKTSVLSSILAIRDLLTVSSKISDQRLFPTKTLTRWQEQDRQIFEIEALLKDDSFVYRLEVEHDRKGRRARIASEQLTAGEQPLFCFERGQVQLFRDNHSAGPVFRSDWTESALARVVPAEDNTRLTNFMEFMRNVIVCSLYPASFVPETSGDVGMLARDAHNFAGWYRSRQLERPDKVAELMGILKDVLDGFETIRFEKAGIETHALKVSFKTPQNLTSFYLDEISDGQRTLIALYSLIYIAEEKGWTLLLDEPENYVSLQEIQPWLMALRDACGERVAQAILCSHHPELIDYLGPDCGKILRVEANGHVRVSDLKPADNAPQGIKLSESMARGWL